MVDSEVLDANKEVISVKDVKNYLGIGINQAYSLVKANKFKVKYVGKRIVIPRKSFEEWLNS